MICSGWYRALLSSTSFIASLTAGILSLAVLASGTAYAQDATWTGPGNNWNVGSNWNSSQPSGTATFTNNGAPTASTIVSNTSINTLQFTAAAPAYSFTVAAIGGGFTIDGGIVNSSAFKPAFKDPSRSQRWWWATLAMPRSARWRMGLRAAALSYRAYRGRPSLSSPETPARRFPDCSMVRGRSNSTASQQA